jgi:hypothetical protein
MWGNATIIDVDARSRAFRGLANGDNGTCLIGCPIHANRGTARMRRPSWAGGESMWGDATIIDG